MARSFHDDSLPATFSLDARRGSADAARPPSTPGLHDVVIPVEIHIPLTPELLAWLRANGHEPTPTTSRDAAPAARSWTIRERDDPDQPPPSAASGGEGGGDDPGPVASGFRSVFGQVDPDRWADFSRREADSSTRQESFQSGADDRKRTRRHGCQDQGRPFGGGDGARRDPSS